MPLTLSSTAFAHESEVPARFTCDGQDVSPPLVWNGVPKEAKSLALIVEDPDAPDPKAPRMVWVHWILYNIPPSANALPEGVAARQLPAGTRAGTNNWQRTGYGGPCPPLGRHRYFHRLYALDTVLPDLGHADKVKLERAMAGHIVAQAELLGTYARQR
jgi:Raf kinase inhibitor-like YbhB/YbcL family protein